MASSFSGWPYHTLPSDEARQEAKASARKHYPHHDLSELEFSSDGSMVRPARD